MKRVLSSSLPRPGQPVTLPQSEAEHLVRVLRLRDGDPVEALDGHGHSAIVTLRVRGGPARLEFREPASPAEARARDGAAAATQSLPIVLEAAVLKGDAMEWVIEKAVELGAARLIPVLTAHTVVQLKNKGPEAFRARWQKIADQALKQCGRLERLEIEMPRPLTELLSAAPATDPARPRLFFDETAATDAATTDLTDWLLARSAELREVRLLIGPEGGWSVGERELMEHAAGPQTQRLGLGPLVLRAETASLYAVSLVAGFLRSERFRTGSVPFASPAAHANVGSSGV